MSTKVELEKLLDIAIASPDVGNVNFNVLRGLLFEIINHLGINKKAVCINEESEDFKSVYDMARDGVLSSANSDQSPNYFNELDENVGSPCITSENTPKQNTPLSLSRSESRRSKSASPRITNETKTPEDAHQTSVVKLEGSEVSPELVVTPPISRGNTPMNSPSPIKRGLNLHKTSSRSSQSFHDSAGVRSDLQLMKRNLLDLQARVDCLEIPRTPTKVKSNASMFLQGDSKTPAQDMIEVINMGRKIDTFDNTIQGLSEMIDSLNTEVKEIFVKSEMVDKIPEKLEILKRQLQDHQDHVSETEKDKERKLEEFEMQLKDLTSHLNSYKRESERMIHHEINQLATQFMNSDNKDAAPFVISSEPPKECYEALDKCDQLQEAQTTLEAELREVKTRVDHLESVNRDVAKVTSEKVDIDVSNDAAFQLRQEIQSLNKKIDLVSKDTLQSIKRLDHTQKEFNSFLEEQKQQIPELQSTLRLQEKDLQDLRLKMQGLYFFQLFIK